MDFDTYASYRATVVKWYWGFGTAVSCISLTAGLLYIVIEYCTQSHLSTEDYESAARGLKRTRWFRKYTAWIRVLGESLARCMHKVTCGMLKSNQKCLVWDERTKDERISALATRAQSGHRRMPGTAGEVGEAKGHTETVLGAEMREEPSRIDTTDP